MASPDRGGLTVTSELRDTNERGDSLRLSRRRRAKVEGLSGVTGSSGEGGSRCCMGYGVSPRDRRVHEEPKSRLRRSGSSVTLLAGCRGLFCCWG